MDTLKTVEEVNSNTIKTRLTMKITKYLRSEDKDT